MRNLLLLLLSIISVTANAQWPVYGQEYYDAEPVYIRETYDKGFIVTFDYQQTTISAFNSGFIKVDINGNFLWKKVMANQSKYIQVRGICVQKDGGIIISGRTCLYDDYQDPFILKLNACMETEWCNIYNTPGREDLADEIIYLPTENSCMVSLCDATDNSEGRIQLMKIDSTGKTIWRNVYANNPDLMSPLPINLDYSANDASAVFSALLWAYEDSTGMYCLQPYWSKINTRGDFLWERYHIPDSSFTYGTVRQRPLFANDGNIIAPVNSYYHSHLVNMDKEGNFKWINTLYQPDTAITSCINSASILHDYVYLGVQYFKTGVDPTGKGVLQKNDTLGNLVGEAVFPVDFTTIIADICATTDNKLMIAAVNDLDLMEFMLIKYNENLEYDSIYTRPITYDSLCPGGITSGTIEMSCNIITGLGSQTKRGLSTLTLAPNPADEFTIVYLPETIAANEAQGVLNVTTYRSEYVKDLAMDVYDINGRQVYSNPWPDNTKEQVLSTSDWKPGIYMIRIYNHEHIISTGKLMVK